jgi:hypothetical protein
VDYTAWYLARGANAELIVRNVGRDDMAVDLESVTVDGRRFIASTTDQVYNGTEKQGGKNVSARRYMRGPRPQPKSVRYAAPT